MKRHELLLSVLIGASASSFAVSAHAQTTCADPTRTIHATGPNFCRAFDQDPASCEHAWAIIQQTGQATSCFYVDGPIPSCQGCGPVNQAAGLCTNQCARPVPAAPPSAIALLGALLAAV